MQQTEYKQGMAGKYAPHCGNEECAGFGPPTEEWCEEFAVDQCGQYHNDDFTGKAFLPHSCNEWIIGGPDEIRVLIRDLEALLDETTKANPQA